jgi:hypothetical protein
MIGIAGPDLPIALLEAAGRYAGPLSFDPDRATPRADRWLESKFMPWASAVLETWAEGGYDHLSQVLFSRSDDTSQRLYYYVCELQRLGHVSGPQPLILDVSKIPRPASEARTIAKLRELGALLAVDAAALEHAIGVANRRLFERGSPPNKACLLAGTAPPDRRLHDVIAACGFSPIGLTLAEMWAGYGTPVEEGTGDPIAALGRQLHRREGGPRAFADPAALLVRDIEVNQPAAVILWRIEEDEAQTWHLPAERRALEESRVPHLVLTRRDWLAQDGVREEIAQFLQGVDR